MKVRNVSKLNLQPLGQSKVIEPGEVVELEASCLAMGGVTLGTGMFEQVPDETKSEKPDMDPSLAARIAEEVDLRERAKKAREAAVKK